MRRKRRNHSPAFRTKVTFAALQGEKMRAELSSEYARYHPTIDEGHAAALANQMM